MRGLLPHLATDTTCVAALEFALLAPTFIMVFAGVVDIGGALYTWSRLEAALAVGANYAQVNNGQVNSTNGATLAHKIATLASTSNAGVPATVTVVVDNGPSETATPVHHSDGTYTVTYTPDGTAANANNCYCPTGSPASWTWGSTVTCGNTCTGTSNTAGKFVTITASYNYTPFFASYGFVTNGAMASGAAVQTQ
jgi:Flp pilus assembly protein TadG